jgi:hypothetical protein
MRTRFLAKLLISCCAGATTAGQARAQSTSASEPGESSVAVDASGSQPTEAAQERFQQGNAAFVDGDYLGAVTIFRELHQQKDYSKRANLAFSLGQCERFLGNFAAAIYYFDLAAANHQSGTQEDREDRRAAFPGHLTTVANNLTPVRIDLTASNSGKQVDEICKIQVGGKNLLKLNARKLRGMAGSALENGAVNRVLDGLEKGWLGGFAPPSTDAVKPQKKTCSWEGPQAGEVAIVLAMARNHELKIHRKSGATAKVTISSEQLRPPPNSLPSKKTRVPAFLLRDTPGEVTLKFKGGSPDELVHARLTNVASNEHFTVVSDRSRQLPPGVYKPLVDVAGFADSAPDRIEVLPGESHSLQVDLEPHFYRQPLFWGITVGVLLSAVVTYVVIKEVNEEPDREPVKAGSLEWIVPVK